MNNKACISEGKFFNHLVELTDSQKYVDSLVGMSPKYIGQTKTCQMINQTGKTVSELFSSCGLPLHLSDNDSLFLKMAHSVSKETACTLLGIIRTIEDPWWVSVIDEGNLTSSERFQIFAKKRFMVGRVKFNRYSDSQPTLREIGTIKNGIRIDTDWLPAIAKETDSPLSFFFNMPMGAVSFYSADKTVDRLFTEYKMLNKLHAVIPFQYLKEKTAYMEFCNNKED